MKAINRRELIKYFGVTGLMVMPVLRQTRGFAAGFNPIYCQVFKGHGSMDDNSQNMYLPNGEGADYNFDGKNTQAMNALKEYLIVPRGITRYSSGGHSPGMHRMFTNNLPGKKGSKGNNWGPPVGPSIDHIIANHLYKERPSTLKHIHFSACPEPNMEGTIDTVSFPGNYQVKQPINDPYKMYQQIMSPIQRICASAGGQPNVSAQDLQRLSILDFQLDNIAHAKRTLDLSVSEQAKLDLYAEQLRAIEQQIAGVEHATGFSGDCPNLSQPSPGEHQTGNNATRINQRNMKKRIRTMFDLGALAIEWELTNVASLMVTKGQDITQYVEINGNNANRYHGMSHNTGNRKEYNKVCKYMWDEIAYFLTKLRDGRTLEGKSLLDAHCVLISGGEVSRPNDHSNKNMPLLIAGRANGAFRTGYTFQAEGNDNNKLNSHGRLLLSVCHAMGLSHLDHVGERKYCPGGPMVT